MKKFRALEGTVHSFGGGYGFIIATDETIYCVNQTEIIKDPHALNGGTSLEQGDTVQFDELLDGQTKIAVNVVVVAAPTKPHKDTD